MNEIPLDQSSRDETWKKASEFVAPLGRVHTLFAGSIRALSSLEKNPSSGKKVTDNFAFLTLLRSPRMQAIIYSAALSFGLGTREELSEDSAEDLLGRFTPGELQVVIALSYLQYKIKRKVTTKVWTPMRREAILQVQVGKVVGNAIPAIGRAKAVFIGGARPLAAALLSRGNERNFVAYRTHLNKNELLYDLDFEEELWQCTHLQILAVIFQKLGFGIESAKAFLGTEKSLAFKELPEEAKPWSAAMLWIESLLEHDKEPEHLPGEQFKPNEEELKQLAISVNEVEFNPEEESWFETDSESLPKPVAKAMQALKWPTRSRKKD
jgi:hypothetical protein